MSCWAYERAKAKYGGISPPRTTNYRTKITIDQVTEDEYKRLPRGVRQSLRTKGYYCPVNKPVIDCERFEELLPQVLREAGFIAFDCLVLSGMLYPRWVDQEDLIQEAVIYLFLRSGHDGMKSTMWRQTVMKNGLKNLKFHYEAERRRFWKEHSIGDCPEIERKVG